MGNCSYCFELGTLTKPLVDVSGDKVHIGCRDAYIDSNNGLEEMGLENRKGEEKLKKILRTKGVLV